MKKTIVMFGFCMIVLLTACTPTNYVISSGFPSTMPAEIITMQSRGGFMIPKMQSMKDVEVLGKVTGSACTQTIVLVFAFGDSSIAALKADALKKYPQADDIVNVEIDSSHIGVLGIYNKNTVTLTGIAVKYRR